MRRDCGGVRAKAMPQTSSEIGRPEEMVMVADSMLVSSASEMEVEVSMTVAPSLL